MVGEALGGRRLVAVATPPDTGWRSPSFAAYSDHMSTPEFRTALTELEGRAKAGESLALGVLEPAHGGGKPGEREALAEDGRVRDEGEGQGAADQRRARQYRPGGPCSRAYWH